MGLTQRERTSPLFLMQRQQDCSDLVTSLLGLCMSFETITEVPRLVVKVRVVPGKEFKHAVPQHEIVVIAFIWQPTLVLREILASSSRHGSTTLCGRNLFIG